MTKMVFLSSTRNDLLEHREKVRAAIRRLKGYGVMAMEESTPQGASAEQFCPADVAESDVVVFLIGHLHGSCPEGNEQSYTELEYEAAIRHGKEPLVFLAGDDLHVPPKLLELEPDAKRKRQLAFRERLRRAHGVHFFASADALATVVVSALGNWERNWEERRKLALSRVSPRGDEPLPLHGSKIYQACDRGPQTNAFSEFLEQHFGDGRPLLFFIAGDRRDCHGSLIERLVNEHLIPFAKGRWGESCLAPLDLKPREWPRTLNPRRWPRAEDTEMLRKYLMRLLVHSLPEGRKAGGDSPGAFYDLVSRMTSNLDRGLPRPLVVIQHTVHLALWNRESEKLLKWYLSIWDEMQVDEPNRRFVIFFSFVYPEDQAGWRDNDDEELQKFIKWIRRLRGKGCHHTLLPPLSPVHETEVQDWFNYTGLFSEDFRHNWVEEFFAPEHGQRTTQKSMVEVEARLRKLVASIDLSVDHSARMNYAISE